jgi:CheY-like chemotaxis protein
MSNLLVVEDDPDVAETLSSILESEGHDVRIAQNGQIGLERIAESRPDAVLLDIEMPILSGPAMAHRLFIRNCGDDRIPLLLLSGVPELKAIAQQVGTPYFLGKPFPLSALAALLRRALAERHAPHPTSAVS